MPIERVFSNFKYHLKALLTRKLFTKMLKNLNNYPLPRTPSTFDYSKARHFLEFSQTRENALYQGELNMDCEYDGRGVVISGEMVQIAFFVDG